MRQYRINTTAKYKEYIFYIYFFISIKTVILLFTSTVNAAIHGEFKINLYTKLQIFFFRNSVSKFPIETVTAQKFKILDLTLAKFATKTVNIWNLTIFQPRLAKFSIKTVNSPNFKIFRFIVSTFCTKTTKAQDLPKFSKILHKNRKYVKFNNFST